MKASMFTALVSGVLLLGMPGRVAATTMSYAETYVPGTDYLMSVTGSGPYQTHNWSFDLTDNPGWDTVGQVFGNGSITLVVEDDGGNGDGTEKATFTFEAGTGLTNKTIHAAFWRGVFDVDASAFADGLITATLIATTGDFYFRSATLTVTSSASAGNLLNAPAPVPEPSTVVLLGSGLLGLVLTARRRRGR